MLDDIEKVYAVFKDFLDGRRTADRETREKLARYLDAIAENLDAAREKFEAGKVPRREGHQLATTVNLASRLVGKFSSYNGLREVFEVGLPRVGSLMRDADFFTDKLPRYHVHHTFDRDDAKFPEYAREKVEEACREMQRVAGVLSGYALEFKS